MPRSKLLALMGAGLVTVAVAGCTTTDHVYSQGRCLTCVNNPLTGQPINYDPDQNPVVQGQTAGTATQGQAVAAGSMQGEFTLDTPLDVDLAYARLRSAFGFRSPDDFNTNLRNDRLAMMDSAWQYNATPGTFYELSDGVQQTLNAVRHHIVLKANIQRTGAGGSTVQMRFFPTGGPAYSGEAMQLALEQRARAALR